MDNYPNVAIIKDAVGTTYNKYHQTVIMSIVTAILLMVTLAWNDVVQTALARYFPKKKGDNLKTKMQYATSITIFVIVLQIYVFPYLVDNQKSNNCK
jgi:Na+/proline symporter